MSNESEQLAWDFDGLAGASANADDSKDERNGEPDIAIVANEGIARFPSGSEQWVAVLQATDEDALRLNRLDVSGMEADTAARLWAKVAACVESDQLAYFIDDAPVSSDAAYDARLRCLQRLEAAFPTLDNPQSPTRRVGGTFSNDFVSVRHPSRMMSLDDVFSIEELHDWYDGVLRGLEMVEVEGATGEIDTNFEGKLEATWASLQKYDFVCLHLEAPDECTHNGDLKGKVQAIEWLDSRLVKPLTERLDAAHMDYRLLLLSDHKTLTATRGHDGDPVPYLLYDSRIDSGRGGVYTEKAGENGPFVAHGCELLHLLFER